MPRLTEEEIVKAAKKLGLHASFWTYSPLIGHQTCLQTVLFSVGEKKHNKHFYDDRLMTETDWNMTIEEFTERVLIPIESAIRFAYEGEKA